MVHSVPARPGGTRAAIRPYEPRDASDVRALFAAVWGAERTVEWIDYAYGSSPFLDGPAMVVAEADGDVVGACPFVPLPVRADGTDAIALYFTNVMVHSDHRRRGLFSRMTRRAIDEYGGDPASLCFCFANERSADGYRELGFDAFGTGPEKRVRVQHPGRVVAAHVGRPLDALVDGAVDALADAYLARRRPDDPGASVRVERRRGLPGGLLERLYELDSPDAIHTRRDRTLYRWLERDPRATYETYVATVDGDPRAAVVMEDDPEVPGRAPWIADAVPVATERARPAHAALLDAVLAAKRDATVLWVGGPVVYERLFAPGLLAAFGFVSASHPLLARVTAGGYTALVYRAETALPVDPTRAPNWQIGVR